MSAAAVSSTESFDLWAEVYDEQPNPLLALEHRFLSAILPDVKGLDVLDAGCGTGRWLHMLSPQKATSLYGVDVSPRMLERAASKLGSAASLRLGSCTALPLVKEKFDLVISSFVLSYIDDLKFFALELHRVTRPGASIFLSDMHPDTAVTCNWKRTFASDNSSHRLKTSLHFLPRIIETFQCCCFEVRTLLEPRFESSERRIFEQNGKLTAYEACAKLPAIYILELRKQHVATAVRSGAPVDHPEPLQLIGARFAAGSEAATFVSCNIERGHIRSISAAPSQSEAHVIDLSGSLLLPGLINAHDHLEFALFPNLGSGPYQNSAEWATEIHRSHPTLIARHRKVPKPVRLWWGAIRNLLSGVTTVCHHNPLTRELVAPSFPVRVLSRFGWAHSLALDPNLLHNFDHTPAAVPFILHAAEGVDAKSAQEIFDLERMQVLDDRTVLVHGLALDRKGVALLNHRHATLVICPTSNQFLFHRTLSPIVIKSLNSVVLGSDSPLTSAGDLLDEIAFAHSRLGLEASDLYEMVTARAGSALRLRSGEGRLRPGAIADVIAVADRGLTPAETLARLTPPQVQLVVLGGRIQLAEPILYERLPPSLKTGLEPITIDGCTRYLRAPIEDLLRQARKALGHDLRLGGKRIDHASAA